MASFRSVTNPRSITSEELDVGSSAPATRPPVQDSAVAIVSLRIRQRSSSERERARASLPLMSVRPGEANRGARGCGNAFLAAGEAEPFAGGRLDGDARTLTPVVSAIPRAWCRATVRSVRALADQRDFHVRDAAAAGGDAVHRVFEEAVRRRSLPCGRSGRKLRTDIAVGQRAKDGIDQCMEADIAVGMREKDRRLCGTRTPQIMR